MKNGIDVSYAQGSIDWTKVKTDFVYIKCNEGINFLDKQLRNNALGAHLAGIPFGFYHFATLNSINIIDDAKAEAKDFCNNLDMLPKYHADLIPVLDIEQENKLKISPNNIELWIITFMKELEVRGHSMMLYSYTPWLNENLNPNHKLGVVPLWIAQYTKHDKPVLPSGWGNYKIWQYSSEGKLDGINTNVDLNKLNF